MGSGSRIDHQHHLVATTAAGLTIEAPAGGVDLMPERQRELIDQALQIQTQWEANNGQATLEEAMEYWGLRDRLRHEHDLWNGHGLIQDAEREDAEEQQSPAFPPRASEPPADVPVQRAAAQLVLDEVLEEHQASAALAVQARDRWPAEPEISFVEDFEAFREIHDAAWNREVRGEAAVPFLLEDATGGLGSREGGRGFGVEIEFDTDGDYDDRDEAMRAIGRDLHEAGLARDSRQHGYHSQAMAGYTDAPNAWRLEDDCTVAGEIVSPILYDDRQSWQNLATVCEIVQRHGGGASERTGGHVHVGLHDYDHDVANHHRLMQMYGDYEDVLFRLAANRNAPDSAHRGTEWCEPNRIPATGFRSLPDVQSGARHGMAVNLTAARGERSDHGEFRLWDGSVDPAVIQTQVNLSLGMVAAAVRGGPAHSRHNEPMSLGRHRQEWGPDQRLSIPDLEANSLSFRRFTDEIFNRRDQMAQAAALYAVTRWQRPDSQGW
ncbi:amidoligase family protein [Streptomyces sp. NPDC102441]|uniref:amidoligase family protein n=1 Tax=Streptomyces sp. NPDC102441 TaxID=3366176 RepID=UPI0038271AC3